MRLNITAGSMFKENMVTFQNCRSSQAIMDKNLKLGRIVEKSLKVLEKSIILSISEFNSHLFFGGGGGEGNRKICNMRT